MKFIHLTDTHLAAPPQRVVGVDTAERLKRAISSVTTHHADAEFCVITGDLTHWGEPPAMEMMAAMIEQLPMPCHLLVGNHDLRKVFLGTFPGYPTNGGFVQYTVEHEAGLMVMLDTLDEGRAAGILCQDRLKWLRDTLSDAESRHKDVYLFMHHAPVRVDIQGCDRMRLDKSELFWELLDDFSCVRHIFFGHIHRACHGTWRGVPFTSMSSVSYQVGMVMDDCSPLHLCDDPPAYGIVTLKPEGMLIHQHQFMTEDSIRIYDRGVPEKTGEAPAHQEAWNDDESVE